MCGRYAFIPSAKTKDRYREAYGEELQPNYNAAPMQTLPIFTANGLERMQWGLVPSWSKEFRPAFSSINARAETVAEKPLYRGPYKKHRCLVPASGFYEWQKRGDAKQPFFFQVPDRPNFSFAGLFDIWYDSAGTPHKSYTIITTAANEALEGVHDRMPVILDEAEEGAWIDPDADLEGLLLLLGPYDANKMSRHEVDRAVGSVKSNHEGLLLPLNSA